MMQPAVPPRLDIVLVGGGHAHVAVLRSFGMKPMPGVRLTLIARELETPYSGMLPGLIAGHYARAETHVDLQPLARFAGARLIHAAATGLDLAAGEVIVAGRPPVAYDLLSLDVGSVPPASEIAGAALGLPVKPVDRFLERWAELEARVSAARGPFRLVVLGGGAGGVELVLACLHRLRTGRAAAGGRAEEIGAALVTDTRSVLATHAPGVRRRLERALGRAGIEVHAGQPAVAIEEGRVRLADGGTVAADTVLLATGAAAPDWLRTSGLALDPAGFVRVDAALRSLSHPVVFAAGDVAAFSAEPLPKSGVYAVRQGPVLAQALRRAADGMKPRPYRPQRRTLALISTGARHAVASWGPLSFEGDWVWRLKDRIDRRWMRRYQELPAMPAEDAAEPALAMRCGGCGAKVASAVLARALARLDLPARPDVVLGIGDDAAALRVPADRLLLHTVDQFRSFIDDPYLFGRIAAVHALGDLFAKGAEPQAALALVTLPFAPEAKLEADLFALLAGAVDVLRAEGAALVGGHTGEGAELTFGLSLTGLADPARLLQKGGGVPGDALILTKPLGTGVIFAADMRAEAPGPAVAAALASMQRSLAPAATVVRAHGAHAATDVTGFGLAGHLIEMANAGGVGAEIRLDALPVLPGAAELLAKGHASSLAPANAAFAAAIDDFGEPADAWAQILFDPQTAGGLLAALPADRAEACLAALRAGGDPEAAIIGRIVAARGGPPIRLA